MFSLFTKTEKMIATIEKIFDLIQSLINKQAKLELEISELRARIKDTELFVASMDEEFESYRKGTKITFVNIAQKCKLKPKDLVNFDKKFISFFEKVEEEAETALTKIEK
jgi:regulator of replication initiation timing